MHSVHFEETFSLAPVYSTVYLATWRDVCLWMWLALHPRTWMSLVWPLAYVWTHYLWQHSGMGTPPWLCLSSATRHLVTDSGRARPSPVHPLTLPLWTRQRPFKGCPCLIPPPHSASTACVYQPVQIRLGETLHDGEMDRKNQCEPHQWALTL